MMLIGLCWIMLCQCGRLQWKSLCQAFLSLHSTPFPFSLYPFPFKHLMLKNYSVQLDVSLHGQSWSSIMRLCVFSHVTIVNGFLSSLDCTKLGHFSVCERSKQIPPQTLSDKILFVEQWTLKRPWRKKLIIGSPIPFFLHPSFSLFVFLP